MQNNQTLPTYFNLTCDGIGYLNRPRLVQVKKGNPYYACTIQALRGENEKTRFDVRIIGDEAKKLFADLLENFPELQSNNFKERPPVCIGFSIGDIQAVSFETTYAKTGETVTTHSIDGRLLKFKFIKVNGEIWYRAKNVSQTNENLHHEDAH